MNLKDNFSGREKICKVLLDSGADVEAFDQDKLTGKKWNTINLSNKLFIILIIMSSYLAINIIISFATILNCHVTTNTHVHALTKIIPSQGFIRQRQRGTRTASKFYWKERQRLRPRTRTGVPRCSMPFTRVRWIVPNSCSRRRLTLITVTSKDEGNVMVGDDVRM